MILFNTKPSTDPAIRPTQMVIPILAQLGILHLARLSPCKSSSSAFSSSWSFWSCDSPFILLFSKLPRPLQRGITNNKMLINTKPKNGQPNSTFKTDLFKPIYGLKMCNDATRTVGTANPMIVDFLAISYPTVSAPLLLILLFILLLSRIVLKPLHHPFYSLYHPPHPVECHHPLTRNSFHRPPQQKILPRNIQFLPAE